MTTVLVEGESDRLALDVVAARLGRPVPPVVVMNGITNLRAHLSRLDGVRVLLLHDAAEGRYVDRVLADSPVAVERFACEEDLEHELVRALGEDGVLEVIGAAGDRTSFDKLVQQPAQRGRTTEQHLRRFFGAHSGHKAKYAALLAAAVPLEAVPRPLAAVVGAL